ncbi:MAG TPA: serine--tRNA ligase [Candidatus Nanoarchaeia archaeon]|nr:serine--tRNA ligase [Candidatus Nanoarchaeia archaeon]
MIDIKHIRENPELVKKSVKERGYEVDVGKIIKLDTEWRKIKYKEDGLRKQRNEISQKINELKKQGKTAKKEIAEAKKIPIEIEKQGEKRKKLELEIFNLLAVIPNFQDKSVPVGGEDKNKEIRKGGKLPKFDFPVKSHDELLKNLGLLDMERGAKISGSGFYLFKGDLARLERALINFMLDFHVKDGFIEINPPQLVNEKIMFGTGNLPKFECDLYKTREGLYPIPTAEVPVTNIYADETLVEKELPKKFVAFTQCYRTEAGKHGSETPGIFRLHEFEKVEMVYICRQEDSWQLHEEMTKRAEKLLQLLELPYRVIVLATADASFASAKTYDLEVWSPAMKKYLETSSCSNCTDFQARRMNTRYQGKDGLKFVHTLNGSGLATPRLLISLIENNQNKDGSINIPKILQPYMNGMKKIEKKK